MPEITLVVFVALGAFLVGSGVTGFVAFKAVRVGWELALDDRRLEPGVVGALPSPRPVGEASGRHHKPQASDGPAPDVDDDWPTDDVDKTEVPMRDEVKA